MQHASPIGDDSRRRFARHQPHASRRVAQTRTSLWRAGRGGRGLSPTNPLYTAIEKVPIRVPHHSIIGDRGKGGNRDKTKPESSDGVVPYWSSHLDSAQSELIRPGF